MSMFGFSVVTPCGLVDRNQSFGETFGLHFQGWYLHVSPHDVTTKKTKIYSPRSFQMCSLRLCIHCCSSCLFIAYVNPLFTELLGSKNNKCTVRRYQYNITLSSMQVIDLQ